MVLGLLAFGVLLLCGAPLWAAIAVGLFGYAVRTMTKTCRQQARARRVAQRAQRREVARTARKDAIRQRTGLDVDLVARAAQDVVHGVGSRVTEKLRARYPETPTTAGRGDWLDLDSDVGALRSRANTDEALRLNEELGRARRGTDPRDVG